MFVNLEKIMSKVEKSQEINTVGCNPFQPNLTPHPVVETDYHKDDDDYIIEYSEVEKVKMTGTKDTDFIINKEVVESSRINRQDYINSYRDDVGILNIIEKVRLSGDMTLFNQTGRVSLPGKEKDALGRPVEDVADFTNYQVDKIEALNAYKKGRETLADLPADLKANNSFESIAKMSDEEINKYIESKVAAILAAQKKEGE